MSFLSSPLISLYYEAVNGVSCTRTDISACGDCFVDIPVELVDIPVELADMPVELADVPVELADIPVELRWFFVTEFSFAGCFWGRL